MIMNKIYIYLILPILLLCSAFVVNINRVEGQLDVKESNHTSEDDYSASIDGWIVGLDSAYKKSQETGLPILANFTGSDWCGWCIRLKSSVFSKEEFKAWADTSVVLYEVDSPRYLKVPEDIMNENNQLKSFFGIKGFPTVWIFDLSKAEGAESFTVKGLGKLGYESSAKSFVTKAQKIIRSQN